MYIFLNANVVSCDPHFLQYNKLTNFEGWYDIHIFFIMPFKIEKNRPNNYYMQTKKITLKPSI